MIICNLWGTSDDYCYECVRCNDLEKVMTK